MAFKLRKDQIGMPAIALANMPIATWAMNAPPNGVVNRGASANNMMCQVAGSSAPVLFFMRKPGPVGPRGHAELDT